MVMASCNLVAAGRAKCTSEDRVLHALIDLSMIMIYNKESFNARLVSCQASSVNNCCYSNLQQIRRQNDDKPKLCKRANSMLI